jgi:hypothetical protein
MPLNNDPNAIPDSKYWDDWQRARDEQIEANQPACGHAPPVDLITTILNTVAE